MDLKKEMEECLKEIEWLQFSLPSSITIGPFLIHVDAVREALTNKRSALAKALLGHLTKKLQKQVAHVSHLSRGWNLWNYVLF